MLRPTTTTLVLFGTAVALLALCEIFELVERVRSKPAAPPIAEALVARPEVPSVPKPILTGIDLDNFDTNPKRLADRIQQRLAQREAAQLVSAAVDDCLRRGFAWARLSEASLSLVVRPEGVAEEVELHGELRGTPLGACVERTVRSHRFAEKLQAPVHLNFRTTVSASPVNNALPR
jgi:hypothetical protein